MRVAITGMHRSGTSFVARLVSLLGIGLGDESALMEPKPDNPTGFWEHRELAAIADDVMAQLGGRWDRPPALEDGWEFDHELDPFRERARAVLESDFAGLGPVGFKDPRTSILLPFWRTITAIEATICCVRNPREVVRSLQARSRIDEEEAFDLWLRYTAAAFHHDPNTLVVRFPAILDAGDDALNEIARHLDLPEPAQEARDRVRDFADPRLEHHHDTIGEHRPQLGSSAALAVAAYESVTGLDRRYTLSLFESIHSGFVFEAEVQRLRGVLNAAEDRLRLKDELLARTEAVSSYLSHALEHERLLVRDVRQATRSDRRSQ